MIPLQPHLHFIFLSLLIPSSISYSGPISKPGCLDRCGNLSIPYPFGIGPGCSLGKLFDVPCNESIAYLSYFDDVKIVEINPSQIKVSFRDVKLKACFNESGGVVGEEDSLSGRYSFYDTPFMFSDENWVTLMGCDDSVTTSVTDDEHFITNDEYFGISCQSYCGDRMNVSDGNGEGFCPASGFGYTSGKGCCLTPILKGTSQVRLKLSKLSGGRQKFRNLAGGWRSDKLFSCSYVFIQEKTSSNRSMFSYPLTYLNNPNEFLEEVDYWWRWKTRSPPVVRLDWRININGVKNCSHAKKNATGYACKENSDCFDYDATNGGYFCRCNPGFEGNPYLGCQDIDECADAQTSPCHSKATCTNIPGSFSCTQSKLLNILIGVGSGLGFILLLFICIFLIKAQRKRKKKMRKQKFFKQNGGLLLKQRTSEGTIGETKLFRAEELEKATNNFNESLILGQGGQGIVYKGMLSDGKIVAIKKSKLVDKEQLDQFINEVAILSQINHRNVVKLLGCCLETEVPLLVYEFIPNGTLYDLIHDPRVEFPVSWDMRLKIAADIAGALAYLHSSSSMPIYHRDIKSRNILLDEKYVVKVSDFGISRSLAMDRTHLTTRVKGTFGYFDPEYFQSNQFTEKSDVYSFGVVLVELLTGQKPISNEREEHEKSLVTRFLASIEDNNVNAILDPQVLEGGGKEEVSAVVFLARKCLNLQGRMRPTMKEVATELESLRLSQIPTTNIHEHLIEAKFLGAKSLMISDMEYKWTTDMSEVATPSSEIHPFGVETV